MSPRNPAAGPTPAPGPASPTSRSAPVSRAARARADFERRCAHLRALLDDENFLTNRSIGNEIGFHTFCYDPSIELEARAYFADLCRESAEGRFAARIKAVNLYDIMLDTLESRRIMRTLPRVEQRRGSAWLADELSTKAFSPDVAAQAILDLTSPFEPGDVVLVTGIGEVYPVLRAHDLLNNMLESFASVPVVIAYPGTFDGGQFRLFSRLSPDNYYRAFDIS